MGITTSKMTFRSKGEQMKRTIETRDDKPKKVLPPEEAERLYCLLKPFLSIDRGAIWENRKDAEDLGFENLLFCDDPESENRNRAGWREVSWRPPEDKQYEEYHHLWEPLTFEEFLAYENITVSERFYSRSA